MGLTARGTARTARLTAHKTAHLNAHELFRLQSLGSQKANESDGSTPRWFALLGPAKTKAGPFRRSFETVTAGRQSISRRAPLADGRQPLPRKQLVRCDAVPTCH